MPKLNRKLFEISYDDELECAKLFWKGYVPNEDYCMINEYFLEYVGHRPLRRMLRDVRLTSVASSDNRQWFHDVMVPALLAKGLRYSAIIVPASTASQQAFEEASVNVMPDSIETRYFHSENEAHEWLKSQP